MIAEDYDTERESGAPIDTIENYCDAHGWTHSRLSDDELVATIKGSWTQYELRGVWREEDRVLQFLALPDIRVPADRRTALYEAIGLVNEQLWLGHFELWSSSGILLFRHAAIIEGHGDEPLLSMDHAETLIEAAIDECERFYPVFQFVLWGGKTPVEAIAAAMIETAGEA
jgi:hypothetical protein